VVEGRARKTKDDRVSSGVFPSSWTCCFLVSLSPSSLAVLGECWKTLLRLVTDGETSLNPNQTLLPLQRIKRKLKRPPFRLDELSTDVQRSYSRMGDLLERLGVSSLIGVKSQGPERKQDEGGGEGRKSVKRAREGVLKKGSCSLLPVSLLELIFRRVGRSIQQVTSRSKPKSREGRERQQTSSILKGKEGKERERENSLELAVEGQDEREQGQLWL